MRINPLLCLISIMIPIALLHCACQTSENSSEGQVITVDELVSNHSKYAAKFVNVRGEIIMDFHGPTLNDDSGSCGFFVIPPETVIPKVDFELVRDSKFEEYEDLASKIGSVQRTLGKAKLIGTLRGKYYLFANLPNSQLVLYQHPDQEAPIPRQHRFVLQKVLNLEVHKVSPK